MLPGSQRYSENTETRMVQNAFILKNAFLHLSHGGKASWFKQDAELPICGDAGCYIQRIVKFGFPSQQNQTDPFVFKFVCKSHYMAKIVPSG